MGFIRDITDGIRDGLSRGDYRVAGPATVVGSPPRLSSAIRARAAEGALLVEFKRVSPGSVSPELPVRTPTELVGLLARAPVAGYSCIVTGPRFGGSVRDVQELVAATDLPVLFKDFVIDPAQIACARQVGASAILLIARLEAEGLLSAPLTELTRAAHRAGLEVVLELHAGSELSLAAGVEADVYGVNVRDLDTLRLEPEVAAATLRAAADLRPMLGLSGVAGPDDARRFWSLGTDGILVGSAIARSSDPAGFVRALGRPTREAP